MVNNFGWVVRANVLVSRKPLTWMPKQKDWPWSDDVQSYMKNWQAERTSSHMMAGLLIEILFASVGGFVKQWHSRDGEGEQRECLCHMNKKEKCAKMQTVHKQ
uniref:Uncharacterized protein n=1 Tax=Romanomermis culicivorax TaxID=13658 RepID=A0A915IVK3_ROMCU